jgi:tetratricopeptide (TPR) repeat protein
MEHPSSHVTPNEVEATDRITRTTQDPGTSARSSAGRLETNPGAEANTPRRRLPEFIEQTRPGAVAVPGFDGEQGQDDDGFTIWDGNDEQTTIPPRDEPTLNVVAEAVDTEEEERIRREQDQLRRERDQLLQIVILNNTPIIASAVATDDDVENANHGHAAQRHEEVIVTMDTGFTGLKGQLDDIAALQNNEQGRLPVSMLPKGETLIGRENIMKRLEKALEERGGMAALVGGGGMGKTSCAKRFAKNFKTKDPKNRFVFWLSSETEASLFNDFTKALKHLRQSWSETANNEEEKEVTLEKLASKLWDRLQPLSDRFEWLLVFDNVPEVDGEKTGPAAFQDKYFPNADGTLGRILFTVRSYDYCGPTKFGEITAIEVPKLDEDAATEMFKTKVAPYVFSEDAARELVSDYFDGLPLAIASAAGEIYVSKVHVKAYLAKLKRGTRNLHSVDDKVSAVLKSALEYAWKNDSACRVLDIAAFLNPDRIEKKLLVKRDDDDDKAIGLLCSLCLIHHLDDSEETYSMHRLHQEAARKGRSSVEAIEAIKKGFAVFNYRDSSTWNSGLDMHAHAEALISFVDASSLNQVDYATILNLGGRVLEVFYNYDGALANYEKALEMYRSVYGENAKNTDLAHTLNNLGSVCSTLGDYNAARTNYEKALEMYRHVYGENAKNTDLARTLNNLGNVYGDLGDYNAARTNFEKALEMQRHVYGKNAKNTDLAMTLNNLGNVCSDLGDYNAARTNYEKALEMKRHVYGKNAKNTDLARTLNNLGTVYCDLGDYNAARTNYEQALEVYRHVYGEDAKNTDLARSLNNLGVVYFDLGDYNAARKNYEEALEMKRQVYGEDAKNTDFAMTLNNLGNVYLKLGDYNAARTNYEKALAMKRHVYGENANNTALAKTLDNLGTVYCHLGDYNAARTNLEKALEMEWHVYGENAKNTNLAGTLNNLGTVYCDLGDYNAARTNYEKVLEMKRHVYGKNANNTSLARTLTNLGLLHAMLDNDEKASDYCTEAMDMLTACLGDHASTNEIFKSCLKMTERLEKKKDE